MRHERLPALAAAYGFTDPIGDVSPLSQRFKHVLTFRIGDQCLLAKPGYEGWDAEHVRFKFGVQQYLYDTGYPIPKLYKTKSGKFIWEVDNEGIVLWDFVGKDHDPSRKKAQCSEAARALGRFHQVGSNAPGIGTHYWDEDREFEYSKSLVDNSRDWLKDKGLSPDAERRALGILEEFTEIFENVRADLVAAKYWDLPHVPIHGEFSQFHCRYEDDKVIGVIDWDTLRLAPRLHDLSRAIDIGIGWSSQVVDPYAFAWHLVDIPRMDDIIDWMKAYLELAPPLSAKEIELFPYVCAAMWGTAGCPGVPRRDSEVEGGRKLLDFMRLWLREASAIQDALGSITRNPS